ncbi:glycosyltransferase family 39 protein, partial [Candidatus Curtissbacteria bacterium]|nr:glycosyltransferase family 39 protein [Candidatus Curtissbacteria bacterium]
SISQTGRDEYAKLFPILFQSFNDYKLPGYIYLDALTIKLFGFSDFTVRLPSAIAGILAVVLIYLLTKKLFEDSSLTTLDPQSGEAGRGSHGTVYHSSLKNVALLATFFLAISPWHLQFSRAAFESNVSLTLVLAGIVFLLYGLKNKLAAVISTPIMFLSLYFYYSPRIFVPLILVSFFALYRKEILKNLKTFAVGLSVAAVISLPIIAKTISTEGQKRIREVSVFTEPSLAQTYAETRLRENFPLEGIFLNQRIPFAIEALKNYASHFSPKFLFFADDPNPRHRTPYHGNFYLFEVATILLGLWLLVKFAGSKSTKLLIAWLLIAPIPAALARDAPHSLRAILMLAPLVVVSATGANEIFKKRPMTILVPIAALFFINYLIGYYLLYPQKDSGSWAYGHRELYSKLQELEANANSITVTGHYWKPYIFYLYYNKIDPSYYQREGVQEKIGKYNFGTTYWDSGGRDLEEADIEKLKDQKTIVALSPSEYENLSDKSKFKSLSTITDYAGQTTLFRIGEWE